MFRLTHHERSFEEYWDEHIERLNAPKLPPPTR
jgi:hypothetical protein